MLGNYHNTNEPINVYIIRAVNTDVYKIGISVDIHRRLNRLKRKHPMAELSLVYNTSCFNARWLEVILHEHFTSNHLSNEWFRFNQFELKEAINFLGEYRILKLEEYRILKLEQANEKAHNRGSETAL
ncbi:hypothetical protein LCGC14_1920510 [marine sediment metagenome]|uniref:Bacteriophage T5 Orf172 DNA-binding domain-containing protein n=1 Tax=marine sediment metagenome TaxID=412755 RepID=A0A0F9GEA8_9ZZZZ